MNCYIENEINAEFDFSMEDVVNAVASEVLLMENCPFDIEVNVLITDDEGIREFNREYRGIDKETDVLSFPNLDFETPGQFPKEDMNFLACYQNPDSGLVVLGDIILNQKRILSQANDFGHSIKREFAFLVAHSLLHLCGYDHMEEAEAKIMEEKQETVLQKLNIVRETV